MKLTIIGSGTMMPTKKRNPSAFLLKVEKKRILLDCGHSTIRRLVDLDIDPQTIDIVFISHFHADHFGDAFNLVEARNADDIYKGKQHKQLLFIGPESIEKHFKIWRSIYWPEPKEGYPLSFKEGEATLTLDKITLETFEVKHVPWFRSVGVRLTYQGKTIVYTGDIGSDHDFDDLVTKSKNIDLLMIEAATREQRPNHYTIGQVKELVKKAHIKKTLIIHIRPDMEEFLKTSIRDVPTIQLAKDGMKIEI